MADLVVFAGVLRATIIKIVNFFVLPPKYFRLEPPVNINVRNAMYCEIRHKTFV